MKESCGLSAFWRLAKLRQSEGEQSALRQALELAVLMPFYRVGPGFYQMAGFWKRSMTWADKTGHLDPNGYRKAVDRLNPAAYRKLSQNKLSETAVFRLSHVPAPDYLGNFGTLAGQDVDGAPLRNADDLAAFFSRFPDGTKICFKPLEGWAGVGFEVVELKRDNGALALLRRKTNSLMDVAQFTQQVLIAEHQGSSIVQAYLEQHPALMAFNPSSVNTIRMWVARTPQGEMKTLLAYLRIGREGSLVDNQSSGGIVAPIDLDTGVLRAATDGLYHHHVYPVHPDHGAPIAGEQLPYFDESKQVAHTALCAFPKTRFAGMDVAIAPDGPKIIETNLSPDREGAAFVGVPTRTLLSTQNLG